MGRAKFDFHTGVRTTLEFCRDMARAVEYLHGREPHITVHRDLKPPNFLVCKCLRIKLGDFGIARNLNSPRARHVRVRVAGVGLVAARREEGGARLLLHRRRGDGGSRLLEQNCGASRHRLVLHGQQRPARRHRRHALRRAKLSQGAARDGIASVGAGRCDRDGPARHLSLSGA